MNDEKNSRALEEIQREIEELRKKADAAEADNDRKRILLEQQFRLYVENTLSDLVTNIDGHPKQTVEEIKRLEDSIAKLVDKLDKLEDENKEILRIKEEQIPGWLKKVLIALAGVVGVSMPMVIKLIYDLSELGHVLRALGIK